MFLIVTEPLDLGGGGKFDESIYRAFKKKVPTFVLLIFRLPKYFEKWFCTFSNSTAFPESINNNIFILESKWELILKKM